MARKESDREDLLREATALRERIEYQVDGGGSIVAGFRSDGSGSLFLGADPVYQFNHRQELRRAYWQGELIKVERGALIALSRRRQADKVFLLRRDWNADETATFLEEARVRLRCALSDISSADCRVIGQVPADRPVHERVKQWLTRLLEAPLALAMSARVGGAPGLRNAKR